MKTFNMNTRNKIDWFACAQPVLMDFTIIKRFHLTGKTKSGSHQPIRYHNSNHNDDDNDNIALVCGHNIILHDH